MSEKEPKIAILEYTRHRLIMYEVLLRVFASLPDKALVGDICDPEFVNFLHEYHCSGTADMKQGLTLIKQYCSGIDVSHSASIINELAVDLLGAPQQRQGRGQRGSAQHLAHGLGNRLG